jgi:1-acyl-sn-glycerol-3-phosphate acyltransferase
MPSAFSSILNWGFRRYVRRFVRRNFNAVRVAGRSHVEPLPTGPVVCFLNHPSWWDPMTAVLLTDLLFPERTFWAPMDADALKQYPILELLGFFGVARDSATGAKEFLKRSRELLQLPTTILWMTPTGSFHDVRQSVPFMPGLSHLVDGKAEVSILAMAVEYTFWNERGPELLVEFAARLKGSALPDDREQRTLALQELLACTQQSLARRAIARDPSAFSTLALGRAGVGGLYQSFQHLMAWLRGQRFQDRHSPEPIPNHIARTGERG